MPGSLTVPKLNTIPASLARRDHGATSPTRNRIEEHLEDDLQTASATRKLNGREIKYVSKMVLEALKVLHEDGYSGNGQRFTDVQLADLESTVHITSRFCEDRDEIGTPIWRSPEAQLGLKWGPATDIWSFGTMVISMIWGDNFFIFKPKVPRGHDEYELEILAKHHIYFEPFPLSYADLADQETLGVLSLIMNDVPPEKLKPFSLASQREISKQDKDFLLKIMKLDPRDRPTAKELLEDEWFNQG
ncbi:serine/threonine protein [Aspergillus ochraceoroseus]|uniref:Serine/threonine protein n=1 Tax=Aspergillus ochraceoroseus TaxID=138278 RepID=A0A0F8UC46_9EURO|nr:serine/threonine protein [Aspergillus ochraceoroseus]